LQEFQSKPARWITGTGRIRNEHAETGNDPAPQSGTSGHKLSARGKPQHNQWFVRSTQAPWRRAQAGSWNRVGSPSSALVLPGTPVRSSGNRTRSVLICLVCCPGRHVPRARKRQYGERDLYFHHAARNAAGDC
jgi:hypothetical protein